MATGQPAPSISGPTGPPRQFPGGPPDGASQMGQPIPSGPPTGPQYTSNPRYTAENLTSMQQALQQLQQQGKMHDPRYHQLGTFSQRII